MSCFLWSSPEKSSGSSPGKMGDFHVILVDDFTSKDGFFGSQKGGQCCRNGDGAGRNGDLEPGFGGNRGCLRRFEHQNPMAQWHLWGHIATSIVTMDGAPRLQPLPASPQQDICTRRSYLDSDRWSCTAWPTVGLTPPILDKGLLLQCNESPFHWVPNSSNWGINWTYNIGIVWAFKHVFCWINQSIFNIHTQFIPIGIFWINGSIYIYIHCIDIDIHIENYLCNIYI